MVIDCLKLTDQLNYFLATRILRSGFTREKRSFEVSEPSVVRPDLQARWTPSFGQVFVTAKVESRFMIQATLG